MTSQFNNVLYFRTPKGIFQRIFFVNVIHPLSLVPTPLLTPPPATLRDAVLLPLAGAGGLPRRPCVAQGASKLLPGHASALAVGTAGPNFFPQIVQKSSKNLIQSTLQPKKIDSSSD